MFMMAHDRHGERGPSYLTPAGQRCDAEGAFTPLHPPPEALGLRHPLSYNRDPTGQPSTRAQHADFEGDNFGTTVANTTIITSRKRCRVEGA